MLRSLAVLSLFAAEELFPTTHQLSIPSTNTSTMKFTAGITALLATGATAFAPNKAFARSTVLQSTTETPTYTFTKSEEIFAEAQEVRRNEAFFSLARTSVFIL